MPAPGRQNRYSRRRAAKKRRLAAMSRPRRVGRRLAVLFTWLLSLLVVTAVVTGVAFYQLSKVPSPTAQPLAQSYTITYADGSVMFRGGAVSRTDVKLAQVPVVVQDAVLAAEDRQFYSEHGASLRGTVRAALNDLRGGNTEGGSGITQQYVKNHYLTNARSLNRKLKELAIAVKLDRKYSKQQILEWYLNTIYWGRGTYGIQAAAQTYFHQDVSRLDASQGAMLAGIIQAPNDYDPVTARALAIQRWNYVLDGMVSTKAVTAAARATERFPTVYPEATAAAAGTSGPTALIVARVKAEVATELQANGVNPGALNTAGLTIRTTIDKTAQAAAVAAIDKAYADVSTKNGGRLREALVAVDPSTGATIAYYGGRDTQAEQFDYAQAYRLAGSAFKPYVLASALQRNLDGDKPAYTIKSKFDASPLKLPGNPVLKNDPSDPQHGHYSLKDSMTKSLNTVYARLAIKDGPDNVATIAHAMGIRATTEAGTKTLQADGSTDSRIGIGGYEVRPVDQAVGFATLADGGVAHASYFVSSIGDAKGDVLYRHTITGTRALAAQAANDTALAMEGVAAHSDLSLADGRKVAAKTGTVGIGATANNSDAWTVGFTPQISVASWVGTNTLAPIYNDAGDAMYGKKNPGSAWKYFMDSYLTGKPKVSMPDRQEVGVADARPTTSNTPTTSTTPRSPSPSPSRSSTSTSSTSTSSTTSSTSSSSTSTSSTSTSTSSSTSRTSTTSTSSTDSTSRTSSPTSSSRTSTTRTSPTTRSSSSDRPPTTSSR